MVLDDVAQRAHVVVELPAPLHAEVLGHGDLDVVDEVPVPDGLEHRVGEPEDEEVLDRLLAEEVVDAEHPVLGEGLVHAGVELLGGLEVATEGLLHHDPGVPVEADAGEAVDHVVEQRRRDAQVEQRPLAARHGLGQRGEGAGLAVVAAHVGHAGGQGRPHLLVDVVVLGLDRLPGVGPQLVVVPLTGSDADDGEVGPAGEGEAVERREDLLLGQVARRPEQDEGAAPVGRRRPVSHWRPAPAPRGRSGPPPRPPPRGRRTGCAGRRPPSWPATRPAG